jgi:hypothetical protein
MSVEEDLKILAKNIRGLYANNEEDRELINWFENYRESLKKNPYEEHIYHGKC